MTDRRQLIFRGTTNGQIFDLAPTLQGLAKDAEIVYINGTLMAVGFAGLLMANFGDAVVYHDINVGCRTDAIAIPYMQTSSTFHVPIKFRNDQLPARIQITLNDCAYPPALKTFTDYIMIIQFTFVPK